ncbi:MAG: tyrosine-type recombinase/integrase [Halomonas sp.]|nr:tyrosine-type recombinase/integrase [Halomonas sp.]
MEYKVDIKKPMTQDQIENREQKREEHRERSRKHEQEMKEIQRENRRLNQLQEKNRLADRIDSLLQSSTYKDFDRGRLSASSSQLYKSKEKRIQRSDQFPLQYCSERNLSKATYHTYKSAMKYWITDALKATRKDLIFGEGKSERLQNQYIKDAKQAINSALFFVKEFDKPYSQKKDQTQDRRMRESGKISKRRTLRGLPGDWRDQIQAQLTRSKYSDAANVLHLSGCRPSELKKGVRLYEENGAYCLQIKGSKQSDISESGQFRRVIKYEKETPQAQEIRTMLEQKGGEHTVKIESPESFQKTYKTAAVKALGKKGSRISPYSARHQFSADLKAHGYDKATIAAAMGHQSDRSQGQYGTGSQGTGSNGMSATASQEIRTPDRTPSHRKNTTLQM